MTRLTTLRFRLTLWYVLFLALTILGFSMYLELQLQINLAAQVDEGLQVAASQLLVNVDDTVDPPVLRAISESAVNRLMQFRFAVRLVRETGEILTQIGQFPPIATDLNTTADYQTITVDGTVWRIYTQQVENDAGSINAWVQLAQSLNLVYDTRNSLLQVIGLGLPLILIVAAAVGLFIANRALRPVDSITRTVQAINATDLTQRVSHSGTADELGRLTQTLNSMLDRLQAAFETERRFTADASHELRTPLTVIKGQIGVTLTRQRTAQEYEETLQHLQVETERLVRLANDLLFLARLDAAPLRWTLELINLSDLLGAVSDQIRVVAEAKGIQLQAEIPPLIPIMGMADHLIRLFLNILDNAVKYTPQGGSVLLTVTLAARNAQVAIRDSGAGIAPEHLPHLFERFYRAERGRAYAGGAGLGLAIAYQIARAHEGSISVESTPGSGTTVMVRLPLCEKPVSG